jgi:hypothetical protein
MVLPDDFPMLRIRTPETDFLHQISECLSLVLIQNIMIPVENLFDLSVKVSSDSPSPNLDPLC